MIWARVKRYFAHRGPWGLVSPAYLWPGLQGEAKIQRRLWWRSKPASMGRFIWIGFEALLWISWQLYFGPRHIIHAYRDYGAELAEKHKISKAQILWRLFTITHFWCVRPHLAIQYNAFLPRKEFLNFVYPSSTRGFHSILNKNAQATDAKRLANKVEFAAFSKSKGVPTLPVTHFIKARERIDFKSLLEKIEGHYFCKLNAGNQGLNAFSFQTSPVISGHEHQGESLPDERAVIRAFHQLQAQGDLIITPFLTSHKDLKKGHSTSAPNVLRIITLADEMGVSLLFAHLDLEVLMPDGYPARLVFPVDETGRLFNSVEVHEDAETKAFIDDIKANLPEKIPLWDACLPHSLALQQRFGLWAIAWDWIICDEGPVLLEGNQGWSLKDIQYERGGILLNKSIQKRMAAL